MCLVQKGNMLVLSKSKPTIMPGKTQPLAVPLPVNTPSLTKESKSSITTNSITLIPGGNNVMVWGQTPGTTSSTSISISNHSSSGTGVNNDSSKVFGTGGDDNKPISTLSSTSSIAPWVKTNPHDSSSTHMASSTTSSHRPVPSKNWADDESDEEAAHDRSRQRFATTTTTSTTGGSSGGSGGLQGLLGFNQLPDRPATDSRTVDRSFGSEGRGERDRPAMSGTGAGYQPRENNFNNFNRDRDRDNRDNRDRDIGSFTRLNRSGGADDRDSVPIEALAEPSWVRTSSSSSSYHCIAVLVCLYFIIYECLYFLKSY